MRKPRPWVRRGVLRKARKLSGQSGLLIAGRFPPSRVSKWPYTSYGASAGVDGKLFGLDNIRPGPHWVPLRPARDYEATVRFNRLLLYERVRVSEGEIWLLHIEPPKRNGTAAVVELCRI